MDLDYERDTHIDESALDVECLEQASLMMRYTRELAKAEKEVARLNEKLKVTAATLDKDIRQNPNDYKIDVKITEAVVMNAIISNEEYGEVKAELIEAQYEAKMLEGAVTAIKQRKDMLQELVRLHGQNYFAGPSIPRDLSAEAQQRHTKETANSTIKIGRRSK